MDVSKQYKKRKARPKSINPRYRKSNKTPIAHVAKIPQRLSGYPVYGNKKVTLSYSDYFSVAAGALGATGSYIFAANGMFDPNITGIGHQPMGFDQFTPLYRRYTVINAQIRVVATTASSTSNSMLFGVCLSRTNTPLSRIVNCEGHSSWDIVGGEATGNCQPKTVYLSASPAVYFGVSKPLSENELAGTAASNPATLLYFHVFAGDARGAGVGACDFNVEIAYTAIWHDPEQLPSS